MIPILKSRSILIFLFFFVCYLAVIANLFYLQILQHTFFTQLGEKQYQVTIVCAPERGIIYDRSGKHPLAINHESLAAFILPRQLDMPEKLIPFLKKHFPIASQRLQDHPHSHFLYVARRLSPEQQQLINASGISDIKLLSEPNRYYPCKAAACLIGITDIDNKGLFGLELQFDSMLCGTPTSVELEKDARSGHFYFAKETKLQGTQGNSLRTTIDANLQFLVYEALQETVAQFNAKEGAAVVIDPKTGDILAMVNTPQFDPNHFRVEDQEISKNTAITHAYELGSVIKICAALAALEEGVVTIDELIDCKDSKTAIVDGRKINTFKAHGIIPFSQVIAESNNIGIAQVAKRLGNKLYDHYLNMGFGKKTGITFPGENKGFLNPPEAWSKQSIISLSYGYEVSANLLQLARVMGIIARNGHWLDLRLTFDQPPSRENKKLFKDSTIATIQDMMEKTTLEGTARKAHINGYRIMCKTGTANLIENGQYNNDKNIYTCAGIVQKGNYQRVIVAFVKEAAQPDLYASTVAAPLFEQIAEKTLINDRVL